MRVAVYSIALNEEQHVARWHESAKDADYLLILDTGSTDGTVSDAAARGIHTEDITVSPWRFDVARNAALDLLPEDIDYCISLDLDEELQPGWRDALQVAHDIGWTRPRYRYIWSWKEDGSPGLIYGGDKIHLRHGYRWKHPVHEVLAPDRAEDETSGWIDLQIHHHPDLSKARSHYLPLLQLAVQEDPYGDRNAYYLARELAFAGENEQASAMFKYHLALPTAIWKPERARGMIYLAGLEPENAERWLMRAATEAPERREPWVALAEHLYRQSDWAGCLWAAQRALAITDLPLEYLNEEWAWGWKPWDLAAIACYWMDMPDQAVYYGRIALLSAPDDERLQTNLAHYEESA